MIKCRYCGVSLPGETQAKCPNCGARLGSKEDAALERCAMCLGLFSHSALMEHEGKLYCNFCLEKAKKTPAKKEETTFETIGEDTPRAQAPISKFTIVGFLAILGLLFYWKFSGSEPSTPEQKSPNANVPANTKGTGIPTPVLLVEIEPVKRMKRILDAFQAVNKAESEYYRNNKRYATPEELKDSGLLLDSDTELLPTDAYEIRFESRENDYSILAVPKSAGANAIYYSLDSAGTYHYAFGRQPAPEDPTAIQDAQLPLPAHDSERESVTIYQAQKKKMEEEKLKKELERLKKEEELKKNPPKVPTSPADAPAGGK